jgi:diguanylate cyclase (GGDEF)-like protein
MRSWQERGEYLLTYEKVREFQPPSSGDLDDRLPVRKRGVFDQDLVELVKRAVHEQEPLSLTLIDIDHFKRVNDLHGHPVGDEVLLGIAKCIVKRLAHKGRAYRYGGEEFAIILPTYSAEEAVGLAERLRKDIEEMQIGTKELRVTASFGIACLPEDAKDPASLLKSADTALYTAKKTGRNRVKLSCNKGKKEMPF